MMIPRSAEYRNRAPDWYQGRWRLRIDIPRNSSLSPTVLGQEQYIGEGAPRGGAPEAVRVPGAGTAGCIVGPRRPYAGLLTHLQRSPTSSRKVI